MAPTMRKEKRFDIRCPVTVRLSNGPRNKAEVEGTLFDIGLGGARLELEQPIVPGTKISLFVHFRAPDEQVTTIRFDGIVERLRKQSGFEIAVGFKGMGRFLQNQLSELHATKLAQRSDPVNEMLEETKASTVGGDVLSRSAAMRPGRNRRE